MAKNPEVGNVHPSINTSQSTGQIDRYTQIGREKARESLLDSAEGVKMLYFDLRPGPKILFLGNTPEGSDTFQRTVIERDRVGGLRLMIWENVKVPFCHYSHAPEESNL